MRDFIEKVDEVQRNIRSQGLNYRIADICKMAASLPAPRFYTDTITALKKYNLYKKGCCDIRSNEKIKMYTEIFARYEKMLSIREQTGQYIRKHEIMSSVLSQQAPSFYYDDDSALKMYYYGMSKKRRKLI